MKNEKIFPLKLFFLSGIGLSLFYIFLPGKRFGFFIPKRAKNLENSNLSPAGKKGNLPNLQSCTKIKTEKHCSLNFFFVLLVPI
jgi:hypothetical protein